MLGWPLESFSGWFFWPPAKQNKKCLAGRHRPVRCILTFAWSFDAR